MGFYGIPTTHERHVVAAPSPDASSNLAAPSVEAQSRGIVRARAQIIVAVVLRAGCFAWAAEVSGGASEQQPRHAGAHAAGTTAASRQYGAHDRRKERLRTTTQQLQAPARQTLVMLCHPRPRQPASRSSRWKVYWWGPTPRLDDDLSSRPSGEPQTCSRTLRGAIGS